MHYTANHIVHILDMNLSPLGWFQRTICKTTDTFQKINVQKKRTTTSAYAQISDFFLSSSPLFPGPCCPMDCPKARDLTALKLLVIFPEHGQPRNPSGLDTWKPHFPQLISVRLMCKIQMEKPAWLAHSLLLDRSSNITKNNKEVKCNQCLPEVLAGYFVSKKQTTITWYFQEKILHHLISFMIFLGKRV